MRSGPLVESGKTRAIIAALRGDCKSLASGARIEVAEYCDCARTRFFNTKFAISGTPGSSKTREIKGFRVIGSVRVWALVD
jgi:hypothetical protein